MSGTARWALRSFAALLGLTCLAKVVSLVLAPGAFPQSDPLFPWAKFRYTLAGAALLEYVVVLLLLFHGECRLKLAAVAWLSSLFVLYRAGAWLAGQGQSCGCLGALPEWVGLPARWADAALLLALAWLTLGSYGLLLAGRRGCAPAAGNG